MEVKKGVAPITIVLETPKEIDLFFHILNHVPADEEGYYPFDNYKATFEEVQKFRSDLWHILRELDIDLQNKEEDC